MNQPTLSDRNFDPIADHFTDKVYGGLKGDIRLAVLKKDLSQAINTLISEQNRPLRILDIGAGLAQISIELADMGHEVTINDISINMLNKAKESITESTLLESIRWLACPYQQLADKLQGEYDLILCHALLEWLATPADIIAFFQQWLSPTGKLSLCFYNPASFIYRNLVMGNFNVLNNPNYKADNKRSLTPNNPVSYEEVSMWLEQAGFTIESVSGLRVFHDYSPLKRGGHTNPNAVVEMEVRYSTQEPFKWLGRYLHILAKYER
ncbi:methyltransferase domain-containing protein [Psychrobacter sp. I-STPA6b]|uniref:methyltransferase domain-containing protein n=1 Tax=Psychrobacter sp. I-STPA6b TaxID=2585718 RepID=UPI001D0CD6D1|nr:methyltransferase domain-containing protein [Psychrobacter sp. I-STPA6b]